MLLVTYLLWVALCYSHPLNGELYISLCISAHSPKKKILKNIDFLREGGGCSKANCLYIQCAVVNDPVSCKIGCPLGTVFNLVS